MSIDFPRAWQLARAAKPEDHHPSCSFVQTKGGILCDCDVINQHREFLDKTQMFTSDGKVYRVFESKLDKLRKIL